MDTRALRRELELERIPAEEGLARAAAMAREAPSSAIRVDAWNLVGTLAGRGHGAPWEVAERAAFVLLELGRDTDSPRERAQLLGAMARAFRNAWLVPYVHARLGDDDLDVLAAAIRAAGGLGFPALEEAIAAFLEDGRPEIRLAAIASLGRMGAESCAIRIAARIGGDPHEARAALTALTEIRSRAGVAQALEIVSGEPPRAPLIAAARYLAEIGQVEALRVLRTLARDEEPEVRTTATLAARAYRAEIVRDPDERLLAALTERDRAVRSALARRLRTLPVNEVIAHAEVLLSDDAEAVVQVLSELRDPEVTRRLLALARDSSVAIEVRARAAGSIEANERWESDALLALIEEEKEPLVRIAAAQTVGAFAPLEVVLDRLGVLIEDPVPAVRGALLWAIQLAARPLAHPGGSARAPRELAERERSRAEAIVSRALADEDVSVRRRAAYVAGNLDAHALVPDLIALARRESERADLRIAAFVGLAEIGSGERIGDLVQLALREDDASALGALARALERAALRHDGSELALERLSDRLPRLLASSDARARAAAARIAGSSRRR